MSNRENYKPGAAAGAEVRKDGEKWTLIIVRELRHPPAKVWQALTDPAELRAWAPFDADRNLASVGPVRLSTVGTPTPEISETRVTRAEAPKLLEYRWGGNDIRWQLEPLAKGVKRLLGHRSGEYLSSALSETHAKARVHVVRAAVYTIDETKNP